LFQRQRIARAAIVIIAAYAILAIILSILGRSLARNHEVLLNVFSHQSGPFAWGYEFTDGIVGPFSIGQNTDDLKESMAEIDGIRVIVIQADTSSVDNGFVDIGKIPMDATRISASIPCGGSRCIYSLTLKDGVVVRIWKGRAMLAGL
jgi:hypothetical protein